MAGTRISAATDAVTLNATDKLPLARAASTGKFYVTGTEIGNYVLGGTFGATFTSANVVNAGASGIDTSLRIQNSGTGGGNWQLLASNTGGTNAGGLNFWNQSANVMCLTSAGYVVLGATSISDSVSRLFVADASNMGITISAPTPRYNMCETDADLDEKWWDVLATSGTLSYRAVNDTQAAASTYMEVGRTGTTIDYMLINSDLGIGVIPNAPLQFAASIAPRKIVLYEGGNNDYQFLGFGIRTQELRYQINNVVDSHVFYAAVSSSTETELFRIAGSGVVTAPGRLGVGGANASGATLEAIDTTGGDTAHFYGLFANSGIRIKQSTLYGSSAALGESGLTLGTTTGFAYVDRLTFTAAGAATFANSLNTAAANAWDKNQYFTETTLTSTSNSIAWDLSTNMNAKHTLTENTTLAAPSNLVSGKTAIIKFVQDSTPRTLAFNSNIKWTGGVAPVVSTGSGAIDIYSFFTDGTNTYGSVFGQNFS